MPKPLLLSYELCGTCRKALKFLSSRGVSVEVRSIVQAPPTLEELRKWVPQSGLSLHRWLNKSGQNYRAMGKAKVDAADEETLLRWMSQDGKWVKRPVLVFSGQVRVGFDEAQYAALFPQKA